MSVTYLTHARNTIKYVLITYTNTEEKFSL